MTQPAQLLLTKSLREKPWGMKTARILAASLTAVDPGAVLDRVLHRAGNILTIADQTLNLEEYRQISLLSVGKAAIPMASAAGDLLSDHLSFGAVLTKTLGSHLPDQLREKIKVYQGSHPIPGQDSLISTEEILSSFSGQSSANLVLVLISGGGSALFAAPAPEIKLDDLQQTNRFFLERGLEIREINTIRKHLSRVKGGQLAAHLYPAKTITLVLSDVMGDPLDLIASGPTVPDPSTFQDALTIIRKYRLMDDLPTSVINHLKAGADGNIPDTPKPGDPVFQNQTALVIASNQDAIRGGLQQARKEGFRSHRIARPLAGEARHVGEELAKLLRNSARGQHTCLIAGGETTVNLTDTIHPGAGGRNLETALSAVKELAGQEEIALITLATDGEDGVTNAAGAVVTGHTLARAAALGLDPDDFLAAHDSYNFFKALDDLLLPGSTGTNVNDLCFLFTY
jgi:hydroxypyruvate reductase